MARPHKLIADEATFETLRKLGHLQPSVRELAGALRVAKSTLENFLRDNPEARDALEDGRAGGTLTLRRRLLMSNSPHCIIFACKNFLGMSDKIENVNIDREINQADAEDMTDEELENYLKLHIRQQAAKAQADASPSDA